MKDKISRKKIRLENRDYSMNGAYFITICTKDRFPYLSEIIEAPENAGAAAPTLSTIIGSMKRYVSRQNEYPIWQKSFYDHIIRGEKEFREIWRYIENNPVNWAKNIFNQNLWR